MNRAAALRAWGVVLLAAASVTYALLTFRASFEMTHFLPAGSTQEEWAVGRQLIESTTTRTMILLVSRPDTQQGKGSTADVSTATKAFADRLRQLPGVARVFAGLGAETTRSWYELYFPHRFGFALDRPQQELPALEAGLSRIPAELKQTLGGPVGAMIRPIAPRDPWLFFLHQLEKLEARSRGIKETDGQLMTSDGRGVLFLRLKDSALNGAAQRPLLQAIDEAEREVESRLGVSLLVEKSGVNRFAVATEDAISRDVALISAATTLAVLGLFALVFRSLRPLFVVLVPVAFGGALALAAVLLTWGRIHGMTLAFGTTLLGMGVDYPVLLVNHRQLGTPQPPLELARKLQTELLLGAATTAASLFALGLAGLPGLVEVAMFSGVGILGALLTTLYVVPYILPGAETASAAQRRWAARQQRFTDVVSTNRWVALGLAAVVVLLVVAGVPRLHLASSLRELGPEDTALRAEEDRVRAAVGAPDPGRIVVARGRDAESALQANDRLADALTDARTAGELADFDSLHSVIWSAARQERSAQALRGSARFVPGTRAALDAEGFFSEPFEVAFKELAQPTKPLTLSQLQASPLAPIVEPFVSSSGGQTWIVTTLRGVRAPDALARRLAGLEGVVALDQARLLDGAYRTYLLNTAVLLGVGLLIVFTILVVRYRSARSALCALVPPVMAAAATLGVFGLLGRPIDLLQLVALTAVLGMGVDYAVFLMEAQLRNDDERAARATALSVALAWSSTLCSYAVLAFSAIPALFSLGATIGLGLTLAMLFAPLALALQGNPRS